LNPPTAAPDPRDLRVEFGNEELSIPDIGLSIKIPADCGGTRTISPGANPRAKQQVAVQILPADMSEAWSIKISAPQVTNPNLTAERCADEAFRLLQTNLAAADQGSGLNKPAQTLTLIDRVPNESNPRKHLFGGQVRQVEFVRWYAKAPQSNGRSDVVRGLVVAKVGDTQFVTFDLTTTEKEFPGAKRMLEAVVAAATFKGPNDNVMDRRIAIQAGINLKRDLTFEKLQGVMAAKPELWLRWYMPAANGEKQDDTEVGYIRYQFIDEPKGGQRGLIDRTKPKANWGATERETGSVILTDLRFIDKNNIVDSQAGYFLRKDGDAEFWSVETAQRDSKSPNNPEVLREMGVRDMLSMQVETSSSRGNAQSIKPIMQGDQTSRSFSSGPRPRPSTRTTPGSAAQGESASAATPSSESREAPPAGRSPPASATKIPR
jgi:hypothetical protein